MEYPLQSGHGKLIEKISIPEKRLLLRGLVTGIVKVGGPKGTVTELLFKKKDLIPEIQRLLVR